MIRSTACRIIQQRRFLNLHEYQSKELLSKYGVNTQRFRLVESIDQVPQVVGQQLVASEWVIKAQVHAGGRGRGVFDHGFKGGVHLTSDPNEVTSLVDNMLGHRLITKQTPPDGVLVQKVMIAEALPISEEFYLAILMDRTSGGPVIVASPQGGMDIEQVAHDSPEAIHQIEIADLDAGPTDAQLSHLAKSLSLTSPELIDQFKIQVKRLYNLFIGVDATQVEINPLGISTTPTNSQIVAFDSKIQFDDNAAYRQPQIFEQRDTAEEDPREVQAAALNLNYIGMDGNIGCLVNGAGLAMATLDLLTLHKGRPANFLDLGGGAKREQVASALKLIIQPDGDGKESSVKCVLVNIFGGIVKCDEVAHGLVTGLAEVKDNVPPVVVRLSGTNMDEAKCVLKESGLPIRMANDLDEAAELAVKYAKKN